MVHIQTQEASSNDKYRKLIYPYLPILTSVCLCLPLFISVYLCLPLCTSVHLCLPLFTSVYLCLPLFTSVHLCLPLLTSVYLCLPLFISVYLCSPLFTSDYICLPLFTSVHLCLPMFISVHLRVAKTRVRLTVVDPQPATASCAESSVLATVAENQTFREFTLRFQNLWNGLKKMQKKIRNLQMRAKLLINNTLISSASKRVKHTKNYPEKGWQWNTTWPILN